jgi:hypothetical protein
MIFGISVVMAVNTKPDGSTSVAALLFVIALEVVTAVFGLGGIYAGFAGPLAWNRSLGLDSSGLTIAVRRGASRVQTRIPWTDIARVSIVNAELHGKEMRRLQPPATAGEALVVQRAPGAMEPVVASEGTGSARAKRLVAPRAFDRWDGFDVEGCLFLAMGSDVSADRAGWDSVLQLLRESDLYCDESAFWGAVRKV